MLKWSNLLGFRKNKIYKGITFSKILAKMTIQDGNESKLKELFGQAIELYGELHDASDNNASLQGCVESEHEVGSPYCFTGWEHRQGVSK